MLGELQVMLRSDQLPVQQEIARKLGVAQSMISRARDGKLSRVTLKVQALIDYATSIARAEVVAATAGAAIDADAAEAASPEEIASYDYRSAVGPLAKSTDIDPAASFASDAIKGINAYLDDGYDPRLIVEQLVVLRRAQHVRRAGRPRGFRPRTDT